MPVPVNILRVEGFYTHQAYEVLAGISLRIHKLFKGFCASIVQAFIPEPEDP